MTEIAILIPCFNEDEAIVRETLADIAKHTPGTVTVYLVDDASRRPLDASVVPTGLPAMLCRHPVNLGQGAALETARRLALQGNHRVFVTMDSDGQHRAQDLGALVDRVRQGADAVFGNRFAGTSNVPAVRKLVLLGARLFEHAITGLRLSDAHNGFRALSRKGAEALQLTQNRMAHATEIKQQLARRPDLVIAEVPVSIRYTEASLHKGQSSLGALPILRDLALRYLFES